MNRRSFLKSIVCGALAALTGGKLGQAVAAEEEADEAITLVKPWPGATWTPALRIDTFASAPLISGGLSWTGMCTGTDCSGGEPRTPARWGDGDPLVLDASTGEYVFVPEDEDVKSV